MQIDYEEKQVLVTGAGGFIGSHLAQRLVKEGAAVTGVDNFITGKEENLKELYEKGDRFRFIKADVSKPPKEYTQEKFDYIFHFASPASPRGYQDNPIETYMVNSFGTHYLIEMAKNTGARMLFASTSEAYGDPLEHPQKETYWGNVNPIGIRACYDESKRFGEMVMTTWARKYDLDVRIVRIFNTYGPRMTVEDGRVVPNFILQALRGEPMTVHGDGKQTRSFCYVDDLVEYIVRAMYMPEAKNEVINIGSPGEMTMLEFANKVKELAGSKSEIVFVDRPDDDPSRREPDIAKAKELLKYEPQVSLMEGMQKTIEFFRTII